MDGAASLFRYSSTSTRGVGRPTAFFARISQNKVVDVLRADLDDALDHLPRGGAGVDANAHRRVHRVSTSRRRRREENGRRGCKPRQPRAARARGTRGLHRARPSLLWRPRNQARCGSWSTSLAGASTLAAPRRATPSDLIGSRARAAAGILVWSTALNSARVQALMGCRTGGNAHFPIFYSTTSQIT